MIILRKYEVAFYIRFILKLFFVTFYFLLGIKFDIINKKLYQKVKHQFVK